MADGIIIDMLNKIDTINQQFVFNGYHELVQSYRLSIVTLVVITIAIFGWAVTTGWVKLSIAELAKRGLVIGAVFGLALNWGTFATYGYNLITNGPDEIAMHLLKALPNSSYTSTGSLHGALQDVFNRGMVFSADMAKKSTITDWAPIVYGFIIFMVTQIVCALALIEIIAAKFGLAILLALAPVMIPTLLLPSTKQALFDGWLRLSLGFAFVSLFVVLTIALFLTLITVLLNELEQSFHYDSVTLATLGSYILCLLSGFGLFFVAPFMGSHLTGGLAMHASQHLSRSLQNIAAQAYKPMGRGVKAGLKRAVRGASLYGRTHSSSQ